MTDPVIKILRVTLRRPNGQEHVTTVPVRHTSLQVKDPRRRQGHIPIADLRVHRMTLSVVLEPKQDGIHLRQVHVQDGGSYIVHNGKGFSYHEYTWTLQFVSMSHLTRAQKKECDGLVERDDGLFDIGVKLPGACHLYTLPPASPPDLQILPLWVPGPRTPETDDVQRLLFFQPAHLPLSCTPTVVASYLYSPCEDLISAFGMLPEGVSGMELFVVSITQAHNLLRHITHISKLDSVTSVTLIYDTFCVASVEVPISRRPTGQLEELTCENVSDIFIYEVMGSLLQFNSRLRHVEIGGRRDYVMNLLHDLRARVHLTSICLQLQNLEDDVAIFGMLQFPDFQLTKLDITLTRITHPAALRQVLQGQFRTLQMLAITEMTPDGLHVCNHNCPMNIIPDDMPSLNNVVISNLTCTAPTFIGILALNKNIRLVVNARIADPLLVPVFLRLRPSVQAASAITQLRLSPGFITRRLLWYPGFWANLNCLHVSAVLLSDVSTCLRLASRVETLTITTLGPTAADCVDLNQRPHPYEETVADLFLAGGNNGPSVKYCRRLRSLTLNIGLPAPGIWNVPAVGQSLFYNGLQYIPNLSFFACERVSSGLCVLLDEYSTTNPRFTFQCSVYDSNFGDF